jgi:UrcA family protein
MKNLYTLFAITALAGSTLAAAGHSTNARADTTLAPPSLKVFYGDLDINNVHGAAVLYQRISFAAESVCRDMGRSRQLAMMSRYSSCVGSAIGNAVRQVNRSAVTEYAASRGVIRTDTPIKAKLASAR